MLLRISALIMETDCEIDRFESPRIKRFFVVLSSTDECAYAFNYGTADELYGYLSMCIIHVPRTYSLSTRNST